MKRWILGILTFALLLAGCQEAPPPGTTLTEPTGSTTTQTTETQAPPTTQPPLPSFYVPDSHLETLTDGAVQMFDFQGQWILQYGFLNDGLTALVTNEDGTIRGVRMDPADGTILMDIPLSEGFSDYLDRLVFCENRMAGYSMETGSVVIFDSQFRQINAQPLPADISGVPLISSNLSAVYYAVSGQLFALDMDTGISRLLLDMTGSELYLSKLVLNDTALMCYVCGDSGDYYGFFSTADGSTLGMDRDLLSVYTAGDRWMAERKDEVVTEILLGAPGQEVRSFYPDEPNGMSFLLPGQNALAMINWYDAVSELRFYSLDQGNCLGTVLLEHMDYAYSVTEDPQNKWVWFPSTDTRENREYMCRVDISMLSGGDSQVRLGRRYTRENPDLEGLARCREEADRIEAAYGVEILLHNEFVEPFAYTLVIEYQVPAILQSLEKLEEALSRYPAGFLKTAASVTDSGAFYFSLVRDIDGVEYNTVSDSVALQYWIGGDAYIALTVDSDMESNVHHELCHATDTYVYANSIYYDFWEDQNPEGFVYDYSYTEYMYREDSVYLEWENRAFIDSYSMTYPHEDRARVMEYAMMPENEAFFSSPVMQAKLRQLCLGLREAFGWEKSPEVFPWEQYLQEPLAYEQ